jgi:phage virion morphogenesis protein
MFRRLATARFLRSGADDQGVWVGFTGKVAQIASVHQYGLRDKPSLRAKAVPYPKRELLGVTPADRKVLLSMLYEHIAQAP